MADGKSSLSSGAHHTNSRSSVFVEEVVWGDSVEVYVSWFDVIVELSCA